MDSASIDWGSYALEPRVPLPSPRWLVYREKVETTMALMRQHLESVVPRSGFRHLAPYLKTHKSIWTTREPGCQAPSRGLRELDPATPALGRNDHR